MARVPADGTHRGQADEQGCALPGARVPPTPPEVLVREPLAAASRGLTARRALAGKVTDWHNAADLRLNIEWTVSL
jgi:hypothetical protein